MMTRWGRFGLSLAGAAVLMAASLPARAGEKDIVDIAASAGSFKTLVAAVKAAGLVDTLKGPGPFTVFAPTDEAFAKLPKGTLDSLLQPENRDKLTAILTYHVVPARATAADVKGMKSGTKVATANGAKITLRHNSRGVSVNGARVIKADIMASNGVIHVIDRVILPPAAKK